MKLTVIFFDKKGKLGTAEYPIKKTEEANGIIARIKKNLIANEKIKYQLTE